MAFPLAVRRRALILTLATDGNGRRDGGTVAEPVAINPALAISGIEILGQWWYDPPSRATMQDCANTAIGVWSEYSLARSVVVAGGK